MAPGSIVFGSLLAAALAVALPGPIFDVVAPAGLIFHGLRRREREERVQRGEVKADNDGPNCFTAAQIELNSRIVDIRAIGG